MAVAGRGSFRAASSIVRTCGHERLGTPAALLVSSPYRACGRRCQEEEQWRDLVLEILVQIVALVELFHCVDLVFDDKREALAPYDNVGLSVIPPVRELHPPDCRRCRHRLPSAVFHQTPDKSTTESVACRRLQEPRQHLGMSVSWRARPMISRKSDGPLTHSPLETKLSCWHRISDIATRQSARRTLAWRSETSLHSRSIAQIWAFHERIRSAGAALRDNTRSDGVSASAMFCPSGGRPVPGVGWARRIGLAFPGIAPLDGEVSSGAAQAGAVENYAFPRAPLALLLLPATSSKEKARTVRRFGLSSSGPPFSGSRSGLLPQWRARVLQRPLLALRLPLLRLCGRHRTDRPARLAHHPGLRPSDPGDRRGSRRRKVSVIPIAQRRQHLDRSWIPADTDRIHDSHEQGPFDLSDRFP